MKLKLILAAVVALSPVSVNAATSQELFNDGEKVRAEIGALPFIKAAAYAVAVNEFCFPATPIKTDDLVNAANKQELIGKTKETVEKAVERARQHLMVNYAACEPATAFVEEAEESKAELDALAQRFGEITSALNLKLEEAKAKEERRVQLLACESFIPADVQWMKRPDAAHPEITEYHKKRIEECRTAGYEIAAPSLP